MKKHRLNYSDITFSLLLLLLLPISPKLIFSQNSQGLFLTDNLPQNAQINPSFMLDDSTAFFIGIPVFNRIDNEVRSSFKYYDLFTHDNDSLYLTPERFISTLKDQNILSENTTLNLLYFGFKSGKNEFRFGWSYKASFYNRYSKNLISMLLLGNEQFTGKTTDFSGNNSTSLIYQEFFVSYARRLSSKVSIGITPKLLLGNLNMNVERLDLKLKIDENTYVHSGNADILINTSTDARSFSEFYDDLNNLSPLNFTGNLGYAVDVGIKYNPLDNLSFSASVTDLGKIKWKKTAKNYRAKTDTATFEGIYLENIFDGKNFTGDLTGELIEELKNSFDLSESDNPYSSLLVPKITFSGTYTFLGKNRAGIVYYGEIFKRRAISSFSVNYMRQIGSFLNVGVNYYNFDFTSHNIGITLLLNAGAFQFYVATNSLLGMIKPQQTNLYNVNFGINFVFKKHTKTELSDQTEQ